MAVIVEGWDLTDNNTYNCMTCDFNAASTRIKNHYCKRTGLVLPHGQKYCPLKSVNGLVELIKTTDEEYRKSGNNLSINGVIAIVENYCDGPKEVSTDE